MCSCNLYHWEIRSYFSGWNPHGTRKQSFTKGSMVLSLSPYNDNTFKCFLDHLQPYVYCCFPCIMSLMIFKLAPIYYCTFCLFVFVFLRRDEISSFSSDRRSSREERYKGCHFIDKTVEYLIHIPDSSCWRVGYCCPVD